MSDFDYPSWDSSSDRLGDAYRQLAEDEWQAHLDHLYQRRLDRLDEHKPLVPVRSEAG